MSPARVLMLLLAATFAVITVSVALALLGVVLGLLDLDLGRLIIMLVLFGIVTCVLASFDEDVMRKE